MEGSGKNAPSLMTAVPVAAACMALLMLNNGVRVNFGLIASRVHLLTNLALERIASAVAILCYTVRDSAPERAR